MLNIPAKTILGVIIQLSVQHACLSVRIKNLESTNNVSVTRRTTVRESVDVVDDFYDIYG